MATVQLNVRVEQALADRLRKAAKDRRQAPGALVAQALELLLAVPSAKAAQPLVVPSPALAEALAALEQRVAALEQQRPRPARTPKTEPQPAAEPLPSIAPPAGAITTVELAEATGTNKGAWNNWAKPERVGEVRHHPQAGSWRLLGKAAPPSGGPERWIWERM